MAGTPAALFRVEGALVPRPVAMAAAWMAANAQGLGERAARLGAAALAVPFALGVGDAATGHRLAWSALRGTSEDRLRVLGEEYAEAFLVPALRPVAVDLVERCRREGFAIVLLSDHLDTVARPLGVHLRADVVVANRLEVRDGRATGRLEDPLVARFSGERLGALADAHGFDLERSRAYGASLEDQLLLGAIARPCAVYPDAALRRVARDLDWPVVEG